MFAKRALVVGVTGVVGLNLAEYLLATGDWEVTGLSRSRPIGHSRLRWVGADLSDRAATAEAVRGLDPTHVFYCTWALGKDEDDNIARNTAMLRNLLGGLAGASNLAHVAMVTGAKHYLGAFQDFGKARPDTPFEESAARLDQKVFYYDLEDLLFARAAEAGFGWSVHRANTIIGYAVGNLMNMGVTLATYGSLCAAEGVSFRFPGGEVAWNGLNEVTDARIVARQMAWAATAPNARNEAFNTANGDLFRWRRLWPELAEYFGAEDGGFDGTGFRLHDWLARRDAAWDGLIARHGLQPIPLKRLASAWHTDLDLGRTVDCVSSMAKCRRYGFDIYKDSVLSFLDLFDRLRRERVIP